MHSIMLVLSSISLMNVFKHCSVLSAWSRAGAEERQDRTGHRRERQIEDGNRECVLGFSFWT